MKKILIRSFVVLFWALLFLGILYIPESSFLATSRSINVFAWGDILEPSVVADFEKTTGIRVNMSAYGSNEELVAKLRATHGEGYDMILPSDYSVEILAKENLLKKLDLSKLNFISNINPKLMNLAFDPHNVYSVPFEWEIFLLGIDKDYFSHHPFIPSWSMVFDTNIPYRVTMSNDPIQSIHMASFYLYGNIPQVSDEQLHTITNLLIKQKKNVNAYADFRADYFLATKNSQIVICSSSYLWRTIRNFPFVGYVMPEEGSFLTIESICIPTASKKEDLVYQFLNFLYTKSSMKTHYDTYGIFPPTMDFLQDLDEDETILKLLSLSGKEFETLLFFSVIADQDKIRDAWVQVKTSESTTTLGGS